MRYLRRHANEHQEQTGQRKDGLTRQEPPFQGRYDLDIRWDCPSPRAAADELPELHRMTGKNVSAIVHLWPNQFSAPDIWRAARA